MQDQQTANTIDSLEPRRLFAAVGSVSGTLYADLNANKVHDLNEPLLAGVTVKVGTRKAVTTADGTFRISNVATGTSTLNADVHDLGYADPVHVNTSDANVVVRTNRRTTVNAYAQPLFGITLKLFNDTNGNGTRDTGESTLSKQKFIYSISQTDSFAIEHADMSATSNSSGRLDVRLDDFSVARTLSVTAPSGYRFTGSLSSDSLLVISNIQPVSLGHASYTLGMTQRSSIRGTMYVDANNNQRQDPFERPVSGFRAYIDANNDGRFNSGEVSDITDSDGYFDMSDIGKGTYTVRYVSTDSSLAITGPWSYRVKVSTAASVTNKTFRFTSA